MLKEINSSVTPELLQLAISQLPNIDFKLTINKPTGNFFYDKWVLRDEFKGTVWEQIMNSLHVSDIGEARLIKLDKGQCYLSHSDLDDRYHLSLVKGNSYLVDLENLKMHDIKHCQWYEMNAGLIHSAVNFGGADRIQLVVRKLLNHGNLKDRKTVTITGNKTVHNIRYVFDHEYSPFLHDLNRDMLMDNFKVLNEYSVSFDTEKSIEIKQFKDFTICES